MTQFRIQAPRGATSPLPIVLTVVFLSLMVLGVWMWFDMSRTDLAGKAVAREEVKSALGGAVSATAPAPRASQSVQLEKADPATGTSVFECRRANGPVTIDGSPDDEAWKGAQTISNFALPWLGPNHPAKSKTVARLLWDDQYLYFLAEMDDTDVYADIAEHNAEIWNNDVFELFFKPSPHELRVL